jgi:uncharacterized membrane-anchored protein
MMRLLTRPFAGILVSAVLLTGILGWMVVDRVRLLASGREIMLPIRPVDPRDLFKGDYARLGFDISLLDASLVPGKSPPRDRLSRSGLPKTIYVTLEQQADQTWKPVAVADKLPAAGANQVVLKGRTQAWDRRRVSYGIERYFVPEGTGGRIEDLARSSKLSAIVAVDAKGNAAIKGLVTDGKRVYEEPLL